MSERVTRNKIVFILGTPQRTEGCLNSPVEREEHGIHYNEKWIYEHSRTDPANAPERAIYWHRYDFMGTMIRGGGSDEWHNDSALAQAAGQEPDRMAAVAGDHRALEPSRRYRMASDVKNPGDLGGYIQPESEVRPATNLKPME